jgi:hypothetical protein
MTFAVCAVKPLSFGLAYHVHFVVGRRASDNVKARFGADTGPTRDCPRRRAIRPSQTIVGRLTFDRPRPPAALQDRPPIAVGDAVRRRAAINEISISKTAWPQAFTIYAEPSLLRSVGGEHSEGSGVTPCTPFGDHCLFKSRLCAERVFPSLAHRSVAHLETNAEGDIGSARGRAIDGIPDGIPGFVALRAQFLIGPALSLGKCLGHAPLVLCGRAEKWDGRALDDEAPRATTRLHKPGRPYRAFKDNNRLVVAPVSWPNCDPGHTSVRAESVLWISKAGIRGLGYFRGAPLYVSNEVDSCRSSSRPCTSALRPIEASKVAICNVGFTEDPMRAVSGQGGYRLERRRRRGRSGGCDGSRPAGRAGESGG